MTIKCKRDKDGQRYWGKGWGEEWKDRGNGYLYLVIRAIYYDGARDKYISKSFSVIKYGYDKAVELAEQWRRFKETGELV